jgi:hypothetical protein
MNRLSRRRFLADVGRGMLIAGVGYGAARDLGLTPALAEETGNPLSFGPLEPLAAMMQETPVAQLQRKLVEKLACGTTLKELVAAAALANARTFGGEDYIGFHTMMAMYPAFQMSQELPEERKPLAVFKVLHRNTKRIQEFGGRKAEVLHPIDGAGVPEGAVAGEYLREQCRCKEMQGADATFASIAAKMPNEAFDHLLFAVQDSPEVHRVVLPYRARDLLALVGKEHAHTMLRQSVHYCVKNESERSPHYFGKARETLPKLLDQYKLIGRSLGTRPAEDGWVDQTSQAIFKSTPEQAAEIAAGVLAEGMLPDAIGEAISLAANQLVLRDDGRPQNQTSPGKPVGSVHGDSIGVHACDSANAWRNMARVSNPRNTAACLILAAYQVAKDRTDRGGDFLNWEPYPRQKITRKDNASVLGQLEEAIRANNQAEASAWVACACDLGQAPRPIFDLLLKYAVSEDGALHAEKYYRTVCEEYATTRSAFRWRQLIALSRVTASEYGRPAEGYAEACHLLKV